MADLKQVMKRAHELARGMEGDYVARLALALRQAWKEARTVRIVVQHQPSGGREWVARITGRHPKYRWEREFVEPVAREWSGSGRTGYSYYEVTDGIYEINEPWRGRRFIEVAGGKLRTI
ncbi:MAG: hypothetical protein K6T87_04345, partial [Roseiflexus sp.]|uniref:hypothetical protein n=1 Tax=Roseiflexus sp. TaxID=2562120 RepID=UPI0025F586D0